MRVDADTLIPSLSPHEMLMYTAELKRSMQEPLVAKSEAVAALMEKLALTSCKDICIGDAGNKVSCLATLRDFGRRASHFFEQVNGWCSAHGEG